MQIVKALVSILASVIIASGCAGSGHSGRGKLSEVIEKSSDTYTGNRTVQSYEPDTHAIDTFDHDPYIYDEPDPYDDRASRFYSASNEPARPLVAFSGGTGSFYENDFEALNNIKVSYGFFGNEGVNKIEGFVGVSTARVKPDSPLYDSINHGVTIFNVGVTLKRFVTSSHTKIGFYYLGGAAYKRMFWQYKNAVNIYGDTDRLTSDDLEGLELFVGAGVNLIQTDSVQLGIEVVPNFTLWEFETYEGFENDIFEASGAVSFNAVLTVLFD